MKFLTKIVSLLVVLAIFISAFCVNVSATADPSIRNMGVRHVICDSLSDKAEAYYTEGYDYNTLSEKTSAELLTALRGFISDTHKVKTSYDDCHFLAYYTDCENGDGKVNLLYTSVSVTDDEWAGSSSVGWNREHVWAKGLGGSFSNNSYPGSDLHHVRPSDYSINNRRGSKKYGNAPGGTQVNGTTIVNQMVGGSYEGDYFEPLDNVKGDVARICLYVYARYGGDFVECNSITNVFYSVEVLLDWCELDPVDDWEMGRNDVVEEIQGNRNVFIDYPEYAWLLFDEEIPADMVTPTSASRVNDDNQGESGGQTPVEPGDNNSGGNSSENNTPENNTPENNTPENNAPEGDAASGETVKPTEKVTDTNNESTDKKTDENTDAKDDSNKSESNGCNSTVAISSICFIGIACIAAIVKKKED